MRLTKKAQSEIEANRLYEIPAYLEACNTWIDAYNKRPPFGVPAKNMIRALRMCPWQNSIDDWARLHITEMFLNRRKAIKRSIGSGNLASY